MAPSKHQSAETEKEKMTVEDAKALDCGVCFNPLKPPIFQGQPSKAIKCALTYSRYFDEPIFHHYLWSDLKVECTDLSDGLPNREMCFKFIVPNSALGDKDKEAIHVKVSITIC
ncbi:hypothetical protein EJB05_33707 [Eragrostis curvula]|uniref:Uncharacterized protein n=1 Tax=Eragrostis curvula TaxID=38414 RepID=A0A5J9U1R5_9POAL|nr:hypothetical protein EJB05_33707 [Eragrostis curvula]